MKSALYASVGSSRFPVILLACNIWPMLNLMMPVMTLICNGCKIHVYMSCIPMLLAAEIECISSCTQMMFLSSKVSYG
jgi:hypothetical protein